MASFSMCRAPGCRRSALCERSPDSGTKAEHWQSWASFRPYANGDGCDYFVKPLPDPLGVAETEARPT